MTKKGSLDSHTLKTKFVRVKSFPIICFVLHQTTILQNKKRATINSVFVHFGVTSKMMKYRSSRASSQIPSAQQVINEYIIDKDMKKINNALSLLDRKFYESLYPSSSEGETLDERFQRLLTAEEALIQKEKLEMFIYNEINDD
jgi:hypothetical protein